MPDAAAITPPVELVLRRVEVRPVNARLVVVAFVVVPKFTVRRSIVDEALMLIPRVVVGVRAPDTMFQSLNADEM